jgi:predicted permease
MRSLRRLWRRLMALGTRGRDEARLRREIEDHLERQADELRRAGYTPVEARRLAALKFGGLAAVEERHRETRGWPALERLWQDLRYAIRQWRRAPVFTAVAILSLALGIGANAAVFSLFNAVLLRPLPVPDPDGLVNLETSGPQPGGVMCNMSGPCDIVVSYPMFRDLQQRQATLTDVAAHWQIDANVAFDGATRHGDAALVSGSYFSVLGVSPALGRVIDRSDDRAVGGAAVAVLSYRFWTGWCAASPDVVGRVIRVNGQPLTVVGVGPRGFDGTTVGSPVDVFVPLTMRGIVDPPFNRFGDRSLRWLYLFGRLRPGVSLAAAQADVNGRYTSILAGVEAPLLDGKDAADLARFAQRALHVVPGARGQSQLLVRAGVPLAMLFVVTGIILAIACANLANLFLARSTARATELAVRSAIGAGRSRLVRQLLVESSALAASGGVVGLLLGQWLLAAIRHGLAPMGFPTIEAPLDWRVLAFGVAVSLATGRRRRSSRARRARAAAGRPPGSGRP